MQKGSVRLVELDSSSKSGSRHHDKGRIEPVFAHKQQVYVRRKQKKEAEAFVGGGRDTGMHRRSSISMVSEIDFSPHSVSVDSNGHTAKKKLDCEEDEAQFFKKSPLKSNYRYQQGKTESLRRVEDGNLLRRSFVGKQKDFKEVEAKRFMCKITALHRQRSIDFNKINNSAKVNALQGSTLSILGNDSTSRTSEIQMGRFMSVMTPAAKRQSVLTVHKKQSMIMNDLVDMRQLSKNEMETFQKFLATNNEMKLQRLRQAKVDGKSGGTQAITDQTITNCNGVRQIVLDRKRMEEKQRLPTKQTKKDHPKVAVDPYTIERLVNNIMKRSKETQPVTVKNLKQNQTNPYSSNFSPLSTPKGSARPSHRHPGTTKSTSQTIKAKRGNFKKFHHEMASTRDARTLQAHEKYKSTWSQQMQHSIFVRAKLQGQVNQSQQEIDLTLAEKIDGEYFNRNEAKKVLSQSFDAKKDQNCRDGWVSSLRTRVEGTGKTQRTVCCEQMEETFASPLLSANKRTYLKEPCKTRATTSMFDSTANDPKKTERNFVSECENKHRGNTVHRYAFRALDTSKNSSYTPAETEIPLIEIEKKPIREQVIVKPILTASRRPQTSNKLTKSANYRGNQLKSKLILHEEQGVDGLIDSKEFSLNGASIPQRPGTSDRYGRGQKLLGKTDISLYHKVSGYRYGSLKNQLTKDQVDQIEETLPCPHDPSAMSHLYLEGQNKLKIEQEAAKRSSHLVLLSTNGGFTSKNSQIQPNLCLVEQEERDLRQFDTIQATQTRNRKLKIKVSI